EQRLDQRKDLLLAARSDRTRADVVEAPVLLAEPEQQRRERRRLRLPADADDDAVRGAVLLHLLNGIARARQVRRVDALRDHAVKADRVESVEPPLRLLRVARGGRDLELQLLEQLAALRERLLPDRLALPEEHVEGDEARRRFGRELVDAARRGMQSHLQQVELEPALVLDHDLAVERRVRRKPLADLPELREVAEQRPSVSAPERELAAVVLQHAAKPVPFRLV